MMGHGVLLLRIAIGAALGGVIGYERDRHGRPVGLRTHFIVALTAATFMVISTQFVYLQHYASGDLVEVDASRIAASVVSAVGFLAGGAILRTGPAVQGLTTAAGLWLVTAIGMCAGAGMFIEGLAVTALGLAALTVLRRFEDKEDDVVRRRVSVSWARGSVDLGRIAAELRSVCQEVVEVEYEMRSSEEPTRAAIFDVRVVSQVESSAVMERLTALPGVERVRVHAVQ